jgi:cell division protein FtsQ
VDTAAAAARVAGLPQVAAVEVTRGWPQTVVVTIAERVPVAVVERAGTRSLVDRDGVLFDTITGDPPAGVVPLTVGQPGPDDRATTAALGALTSLPREVREQVTGVAATTADDVTLTLTDGRTVLWGSADQTDRKSRVLDALLDQIAAGTLEPAGTLDVSTPDAVVLR